jgi:hypothetical protein
MEQWKITFNPSESTQITFTTRRAECPQVSINNFPIPIKQEVKYVGLHLGKKKLTWSTHIKAKRRQLELKIRNMNRLMDKYSQLSLGNKITICNLQTFQSKTSRKLANAHWYISNCTLHNDLNIPYVTEVIRVYAKEHKNRTAQNNNQLIRNPFKNRGV